MIPDYSDCNSIIIAPFVDYISTVTPDYKERAHFHRLTIEYNEFLLINIT